MIAEPCKDFGGGNPLSTSWDGRSASIDSRRRYQGTDRRFAGHQGPEVVQYVALIIRQDDGVHQAILQNVGDPDYFF